MKLEHLELANFKNYRFSELRFDGKFICFTGRNGQGKTNLLDAIYYLSLTKSFLNPSDMANIRHNEDFFRIAGRYALDDKSLHSVACIQERNQRKKIIVNDKNCDRFADHIGEFPLVIISPADFELFGSGEERRKFIDSTISQFDKTYLDNLIQYNRALTQRNRLLKNISEKREDISLLAPYDFQLEQFAMPIHRMRAEFLTGFLPFFNSYYSKIAQTGETVETLYETELQNHTLSELLTKYRSRDIALGHTTSGIHREDFTFMINGFHARKFGSQGQQKSFLIAMKLAKHKYIGQRKNNIPLLLIDDLHDKLDAHRVQHLFSLLNNGDFDQIFITDTQKERLDPLMHDLRDNSCFFHIENGTAQMIEP
jgi:DNA replication and repair protein RecF